jgi:hypothetical protein
MTMATLTAIFRFLYQTPARFAWGIVLLLPINSAAQIVLEIAIPDVEISANVLERGDGDTYGLGNFQCSFQLKPDGNALLITGKIIFQEQANDFTTISGVIKHRIKVPELEYCASCEVVLENLQGSCSGPNIGARGYRWFEGQGVIRRAKIRTDIFGNDIGNIGGIIQFEPLRAIVTCAYAATTDTKPAALHPGEAVIFDR